MHRARLQEINPLFIIKLGFSPLPELGSYFFDARLFGLVGNELLFIRGLFDFVGINMLSLIGRAKDRVLRSWLSLWRCPQPCSPRPLAVGQAEELGHRLIETGSLWPIRPMAPGPVRVGIKPMLFHSDNHFHSRIIGRREDLSSFRPQSDSFISIQNNKKIYTFGVFFPYC